MGCTMDSTQWITGLTSVSQKVSCPLSDNTPFGTQPSQSKETCRTVSLRLKRSFSDQTSTELHPVHTWNRQLTISAHDKETGKEKQPIGGVEEDKVPRC
ncbi:unnamed protein product [Natator depressus]